MKDTYTHIKDSLLIAILSGSATDEEHDAFEKWLEEDEANRVYFDQFQKIWLHSSSVEGVANISLDNDWSKIKQRIPFEEEQKGKKRWLLPLQVAASIVLCLGAYLLHRNVPGLGFLNQTTAQAEVSDIVLKDETKVYLNAGARLIYPNKFKNDRKVELKGEGYFDVKSDPQHPFIIKTSNGTIKVVGTSFNVDQTDNVTKVTVNSGTVILTNANNQKVTLTQGEVGYASPEEVKETVNSDLNFDSWKTNILRFDNNTLQEICKVVEKHFNVKIVNNAKTDAKLTTVFEDQTLEEVIEELKIQFDLIVKKKGGSYILTKKV
ncbi:FecR family protein [Prolixibacteraceae bacterium JC049]|nr:FecR family protein [Prolixibacteraceae bacterium JC049]